MLVLKSILKSPLQSGACITAIVAVAGSVYALTHSRSTPDASQAMPVSATACRTIVFDPQPPLNVRTTPIEKSGNVIATLKNGEVLTVVGERDGWLQISAPATGWIYQNLTRKQCDSDPPAATLTKTPPLPNDSAKLPSSAPTDSGSRILAQAKSQFQAGNLDGAIALANAVPVDSAAYEQAQAALKTMPHTWNQARSKYDTAQQAMEARRWNDILKIATEFPDIRFWREKLAPIVKQAIRMQYLGSTQSAQSTSWVNTLP